MRLNFIIGYLIFMLNLFDGIVTYFAINMTDISIEFNPLLQHVYPSIGNWFLLPKIAIALLGGILVGYYWKKSKIVRISSIVLVTIYGFTVVYHSLSFKLIEGF